MLQLTFNPGLTLTGFRTTRPRFREKKEGKYAKTLAKFQVTAIFRMQDRRRNVLLKFTEMGTNMAAGNQQKHLSLSFATKACIYLSRNSKTSKYYFFSNTRTVQIAKFLEISPEMSHFFFRPSCKCRVTQKLRNSSVVYNKSKNPYEANFCMHSSF